MAAETVDEASSGASPISVVEGTADAGRDPVLTGPPSANWSAPGPIRVNPDGPGEAQWTAPRRSPRAADGRRWKWVRRGLLLVYALLYLWSFQVHGVPISRKSVMLSVLIPVVIGQIGRPWRRWVWTVLELAVYVAMWFAYDYSRGVADRLGFPVQVEMPRNIDRFLFFGTDPNVWVQHHFYDPAHVRWYDVAGSIVYYTHFVLPAALAVILWVSNREQWGRYVRRFSTVLFAGVIGFILLPTVPPWMASSTKFPFRILEPLARPTTRGWAHLGRKAFVDWVIQGRDWANPTAAMPSLHAGFALLVPLFLWPFVKHWWARIPLVIFPLLMAMTIVYFGEHYVADVLGGWLVVAASFLFWGWWERHRAEAGLPVDGPIGRVLRRWLGEPTTGMANAPALHASGPHPESTPPLG